VPIDAMLPARGDFSLGRAFLEELAEGAKLPYVLSNVTCQEPLPWPTTRTVTRGGTRIVVYGLANADLQLPGCEVRDPAATLASLPVDDTVYVVLSDLDKGKDEALGKSAPGVDFILRADAQESLASPLGLESGGLVLSSGARGKSLGLLTVTPTAGARGWRDTGAARARAQDVDDADTKLAELAARKAEAGDDRTRERLARQEEFWSRKRAKAAEALSRSESGMGPRGEVSNELRPLGTDVADHPDTLARVTAFKAEHSGSASVDPANAPSTGHEGAGFGPWVGNNACAGCHPSQAAQWQTTGHARAWASLVAQQRQYDADCFTCHVTGARDPAGPKDARQLGGLEDVGCEACHGAGREHSADPQTARMVRNPPTSQCTGCHDSRQDGGRFDEPTYRARVKH
jgi:hypothetical protein